MLGQGIFGLKKIDDQGKRFLPGGGGFNIDVDRIRE